MGKFLDLKKEPEHLKPVIPARSDDGTSAEVAGKRTVCSVKYSTYLHLWKGEVQNFFKVRELHTNTFSLHFLILWLGGARFF